MGVTDAKAPQGLSMVDPVRTAAQVVETRAQFRFGPTETRFPESPEQGLYLTCLP